MSNEYFHSNWHELFSAHEHYSISYNINDLWKGLDIIPMLSQMGPEGSSWW